MFVAWFLVAAALPVEPPCVKVHELVICSAPPADRKIKQDDSEFHIRTLSAQLGEYEMHGLTTIQKINAQNAEAAEIMARAGYELPKFERSPDAPAEVHTYIPLGQTKTPAEKTAA